MKNLGFAAISGISLLMSLNVAGEESNTDLSKLLYTAVKLAGGPAGSQLLQACTNLSKHESIVAGAALTTALEFGAEQSGDVKKHGIVKGLTIPALGDVLFKFFVHLVCSSMFDHGLEEWKRSLRSAPTKQEEPQKRARLL